MQYRTLPRNGEPISIIGLGTGSLGGTQEQMVEVFTKAFDHGVNLVDLAPIYQQPFFPAFSKAIEGRRDQVKVQSHLGMVYKNGECQGTKSLDEVKAQLAYDLNILRTDYVDFGLVHCIDDQAELDRIFADGTWTYMKGLKEQGTIRHLGLSTHTPGIARRLLETGMLDLIMFSINAAYDFEKGDDYMGNVAERTALYRECESAGVGISVMKPFGGGRLLDDQRSVFGHALTHVQCMQYALDRPAVLSVLPGIRNMEDLDTALHYLDATVEEKDYSTISAFTPKTAEGICVYCNHCLPCPAELDIGLVNKYYDLAQMGDKMAADHYHNLPHKASACIQCGHCAKGCPFHVDQPVRMKEIAAYFGE